MCLRMSAIFKIILSLERFDSAENILANKVTTLLDREEQKDLADIWGFCYFEGILPSDDNYVCAKQSPGVFPADLGRVLCSVKKSDWEAIRWIQAPPAGDVHCKTVSAGGEFTVD